MSIDEILQLPQRKLVVAQADVALDKKSRNEIFILMVEESRGSAGGRAAGSGHRKISKVYGFSCDDSCEKVFETEDPGKVEQFDIPYSAVAMDITLSDGRPYVVQGIVDPDFVASYKAVAGRV
ncbi:MAG: hypothetical protein QXJ74_08595 [Nitrososphaera sp.]|uniref:hypothetical protein n=1 Tax=Nitrososphaera sp. TaxID=1971748 RepID=UPI0018015964|nr:hypothetical protein [Nitrososphaera sp.]NWG36786.1 hypothetical protein [Nitrososphaera sp.]